MKQLKLIGFLCGIIIITSLSCEKNKHELPVEFKLGLLDTLGYEKTVFNQGENIVFSFLMTNKSSNDIMLENFFPNDGFFRVYQRITNGGSLNFGKPYNAICYIGYFTIPTNGYLEFKCPWVISNNSNHYGFCIGISQNGPQANFLPIGNFYTSFSSSFNIGNIQTEEKHFEIKFTVK